MVSKVFCDFCSKDITNDVIYNFRADDSISEEIFLDKDACEKCKEKIEKVIEDVI